MLLVQDRPYLLIGNLTADFVAIQLGERMWPDVPFPDWAHGNLDVKVGAIRAEVRTQLEINGLRTLRKELDTVYASLTGKAHYGSWEPDFVMDIVGDGRGHFRADCEVRTGPTYDDRFRFGIDFDQTYIPAMLRQLDQMLIVF